MSYEFRIYFSNLYNKKISILNYSDIFRRFDSRRRNYLIIIGMCSFNPPNRNLLLNRRFAPEIRN